METRAPFATGLVALLVAGCAGGGGGAPPATASPSPPTAAISTPSPPDYSRPAYSPLTALLPSQPTGRPPAATGPQAPPTSAVAFTCWDMCGAGGGPALTLRGVGTLRTPSSSASNAITPITLTMAVDAALLPTAIWLSDSAPRSAWVRGTEGFYTGYIPLTVGRLDYVWAFDGCCTDPYNDIYLNVPNSLRFTTFGTAVDYGFAVGFETPASAVPIAGAATFSGALAGSYLRSSQPGDYVPVAAPMTLAVDFGTRTATFASTAWRDYNQVYSGTALSGSLSFSTAQNAFSGTLTTANGALSGPVSARFFGPLAQEVGGGFYLRPTGPTGGDMIGGFGAVR